MSCLQCADVDIIEVAVAGALIVTSKVIKNLAVVMNVASDEMEKCGWSSVVVYSWEIVLHFL